MLDENSQLGTLVNTGLCHVDQTRDFLRHSDG